MLLREFNLLKVVLHQSGDWNKVTRPFASLNRSITTTRLLVMPQPKLLDSVDVVKSVFKELDTIITDCDGVLWLEKQPIQGANTFFKTMRSLGKRIIFATNNNTKSRESLLSKLNSLGFEATIDEIMVTTFAVPIALKKIPFKGKVYCLGTQILRKEIESAGFTVVPPSTDLNENVSDAKLVHPDHIDYELIKLDPEVAAVVIGMDYGLSNIKMIRACSYASKVDPNCVICTNSDYTFPGPGGLVIPGTGSFADLIERVTGRKMLYCGKPETFFFECIKHIHPTIKPERSLMIGDRCDTDIAFGHNNRIKFSLLVGTGLNNLTDVQKFVADGANHLIPTHFVQSLGDLNKYFSK